MHELYSLCDFGGKQISHKSEPIRMNVKRPACLTIDLCHQVDVVSNRGLELGAFREFKGQELDVMGHMLPLGQGAGPEDWVCGMKEDRMRENRNKENK